MNQTDKQSAAIARTYSGKGVSHLKVEETNLSNKALAVTAQGSKVTYIIGADGSRARMVEGRIEAVEDVVFDEGQNVWITSDNDLPATYIAALADGRHLVYGGQGGQRSDRQFIVTKLAAKDPR